MKKNIVVLGFLALFASLYGCSDKGTYDEGYFDGKEKWREIGYQEGYSIGYDEGYEVGREDGASEGYQHGYDEAELYYEDEYSNGYVAALADVEDAIKHGYYDYDNYEIDDTSREIYLADMQPVESSAISSVGFLDHNLYVEFTSGGIYKYYDVDSLYYNTLLTADSPGSYFNKYVKNEFEYDRLQ